MNTKVSLGVANLQQSGQAKSSSKTGTREGDSLVGAGSDGGRGRRDVAAGTSGLGVGGAVVGGDSNRLGQGARAVGDSQGRGLRDGVGDTVVGQDGGLRAVGGQSSDDLRGVDGTVGAGRDGASQGKNSGERELHFDCWLGLSKRRGIKG